MASDDRYDGGGGFYDLRWTRREPSNPINWASLVRENTGSPVPMYTDNPVNPVKQEDNEEPAPVVTQDTAPVEKPKVTEPEVKPDEQTYVNQAEAVKAPEPEPIVVPQADQGRSVEKAFSSKVEANNEDDDGWFYQLPPKETEPAGYMPYGDPRNNSNGAYADQGTSTGGTTKVLGTYPAGTMDYLRENDIPVEWLNTEDGQYWLESRNAPQVETVFPSETNLPTPFNPVHPSRDQILESASNFLAPVMNFGVPVATAEAKDFRPDVTGGGYDVARRNADVVPAPTIPGQPSYLNNPQYQTDLSLGLVDSSFSPETLEQLYGGTTGPTTGVNNPVNTVQPESSGGGQADKPATVREGFRNISDDMTDQEIYDAIYNNALLGGESDESAKITAQQGLEDWRDYNPRDIAAKVGATIENLDEYEDYLASTDLYTRAFESEEERVAYEQELGNEFERLAREGKIEGLTTSEQIREKLDTIKAQEEERINDLKKRAEENSQKYESDRKEAEKKAEEAGYVLGTPEADKYIYDLLYGDEQPKNKPAPQTTVRTPLEMNKDRTLNELLEGNPFAQSINNMLEEYDLSPQDRAVFIDNAINKYEKDVDNAMRDRMTENAYVPSLKQDAPSASMDWRMTGEVNDTLAFLLDSMKYYDANGNTVFKNPDGTYTDANGKLYKGQVTPENTYRPEDVLNYFVNWDRKDGEPLFRGLDEMYERLTPEERKGMDELLNTGFFNGAEGREYANLTAAEYERLAQLFYDNMPALQVLAESGLLGQDVLDANGNLTSSGEMLIAKFFFKALKDNGNKPKTPKTGSGYGYGRGGYGGGGGGGGYGGGYGSRSGSSAPSSANQRQNRVYNIMKNWSF